MPSLENITPDEAIDAAEYMASLLSAPSQDAAFMAGMLLVIQEALTSDCACSVCVKFRDTFKAMESM